MRVISGSARGTKINSIDDISTRPTLDRVKESFFNIIRNYIQDDTIVLDLFAGSGAIGIEFLSRGAAKVVFADNSPKAKEMICQNLEKTHLKDKAKVFLGDYKKVLNKLKEDEEVFDIIYLDPPYKQDIAVDALLKIEELKLIRDDGLIIIETDESDRETEELKKSNTKYNIYDIRKYGRATLIFLKQ